MLARNVNKPDFSVFQLHQDEMSLEERVKQLEFKFNEVKEELRVVRQRLWQVEHLYQPAVSGSVHGECIEPWTILDSDGSSLHVSTRGYLERDDENVVGTIQPKRVIRFHQNPWNEDEEDIPWEGTDNIDPEIEQLLKSTGQWVDYLLEKKREWLQRCHKPCPAGHDCDLVHDASMTCPPCTVLLENYRLPCKHRIDVLCYEERNLKKCPNCAAVTSSSAPVGTPDSKVLLSLLEEGFARLKPL